MKVIQPLKFHNRFDIEVRNKYTGELKQKGYAENIVLNQMYGRLCNFQTYFVNIHFGTGTGTLSSERTSLFAHLGTKTAQTEEIIKATPTSKWTRKIILNPEEFVGNTITEVGIAFGSTNTNLITHAMIKDSEGNPLSISKTNIDIVIIYATIFIELHNKNDNIKFTSLPNKNILLNYLVGGAAPAPNIILGEYYRDNLDLEAGGVLSIKTPTKTIDTPNKKIVFSTRFSISEGNGEIGSLGLVDIFGVRLPESNTFTSKQLTNINLGVGNGMLVDFNFPNRRIENVQIYKNGITTSDYVLSNTDSYYGLPTPMANKSYLLYGLSKLGSSETNVFAGYLIQNIDRNVIIFSIAEDKVDLLASLSVQNAYISFGVNAAGTSVRTYNGATYYYYNYLNGLLSEGSNNGPYQTYPFDLSGYILNGGGVLFEVKRLLPNTKQKIIFNTPPVEGDVITADYTVPYIPKTSDYILDVTFELQFGEGV